MEGLQLMRQQLAHIEEGHVADPQQIAQLRVVHDRGHLTVLVTIDKHPAMHHKRAELVLSDARRTVGRMGAAVHRLVLVEDALLLDGARQVIEIAAARLEALDGGAQLMAGAARLIQPRLQGHRKVHQCARDGLIDIIGPQCTIQMDLRMGTTHGY